MEAQMLVRRPKVLIVDDEEAIVLSLHHVLYQDNDRYDVLVARSAEVAQQILADTRVTVLVTDIHLPDQSGMDLLSWVAVQAPSTRVIVMTAFDVDRIRDRAHAFGCLCLLRKPFDVHEMRAAIVRALTLRDSFAGSLSELSCVDVIQMLCIARKSTALRLSEGHRAGVIHIEAGEPVHAVWDDLVGEEAFFRMLAVKMGAFSTAPLPTDVTRTLRGDWQYLIIEGVRRLDEAGRDAPADSQRPSLRLLPSSIPPPRLSALPLLPPAPSFAPELGGPHSRPRPAPTAPPPTPPAVTLSRSTVGSMLRGPAPTEDPTPPARSQATDSPARPEVTRLIDEGFAALRAGRRADARRAWEEARSLSPSNRTLELNLRKLGPAGDSVPPAASRETG